MNPIDLLLSETAHRPWAMPTDPWLYYQEWNEALFLHWEVPQEWLSVLVPPTLPLDTFEGKYYVSLVPFTMQRIRPRLLPAVPLVSDFHEINLRTYIIKEGKQGVYFINIEAQKLFSAMIAKGLSGLPYEKATIKRSKGSYLASNPVKKFSLAIDFEIGKEITTKTALDAWLTERYCLYLNKGKQLYRYEIHHKAWQLQEINLQHLQLHYKIGKLTLDANSLQLAHYSKGVEVIAWKRQKITL